MSTIQSDTLPLVPLSARFFSITLSAQRIIVLLGISAVWLSTLLALFLPILASTPVRWTETLLPVAQHLESLCPFLIGLLLSAAVFPILVLFLLVSYLYLTSF